MRDGKGAIGPREGSKEGMLGCCHQKGMGGGSRQRPSWGLGEGRPGTCEAAEEQGLWLCQGRVSVGFVVVSSIAGGRLEVKCEEFGFSLLPVWKFGSCFAEILFPSGVT